MKLLLIEDSENLQKSLSIGLRRLGYAVDQARDGREGLAYAQSNEYEIIILDLMLPRIDGLTLLKTMRGLGIDAHVLILSARDLVDNRIEGLDLGADDYMVKPFSFDELRSRLQALARRRYNKKSPVVELDGISIDTVKKQVLASDENVSLTPTEYSILEHLSLRRGHVLSTDQIQSRLSSDVNDTSKNAVEVHISSIRRKFRSFGLQSPIRTHRGFGYVID